MSLSEWVADLNSIGTVEKQLKSRTKSRTGLVALIDPDNFGVNTAVSVAKTVDDLGFTAIFVGGSTIGDQGHLDAIVSSIRNHVTCPVILFPGNVTGISRHASAILFSSLLNSTNTYFIVGAQALGAIQVEKHGMEAIPMAYLVFGGESTTSFIGQVRPIPYGKPSIAIMYSLTAQYLGMRALYLEAGSGSDRPIPPEIVAAVRKHYKGLLIVGGGITSAQTSALLSKAGADLLVIGNLLETKDFANKIGPIVKAVKGNP